MTQADLELRGPADRGFDEVLSADALEFVGELHRRFDPRRRELLEARAARRERLRAGEMLDFLPDTREVREGDWRVEPVPDDLAQRWVEITGPTDRKMVINALNSGADGFMADFEDANSPTWRNMVLGHSEPQGCDRGDDLLRLRRWAPLRARARPRDAAGETARLAPPGAPPADRLRARFRGAVRLRPLLLSLRATTAARRNGTVLLSAEDGVPSRSAAVERRLLLQPGCARHRPGHDQGHGAHRDAPRRLRDGRDPLRAARALGRAQRRALGLHLLGHQVLSGAPGDGAARPRRRHDDRALHAGLHRAARGDLSPSRSACHGGNGGADPFAPRRGSERQGAGGRAGGQAARGLPGI